MDETTACADLCESRGFPRQADRLRQAASGRLVAFVVMEEVHSSKSRDLGPRGERPVAVFADPEEAGRDALDRDVRAYRERNLYRCGLLQLRYNAGDGPPDLGRRIGEILGRPFKVPEPEGHVGPLFPADATDEQMRAIVEACGYRLYRVAEAVLSA